MKITLQEQNIAIAKILGIETMSDGWRPSYNDPDNPGLVPESEPLPIPNYTGCLNACREMEQWAGENTKNFWVLYLDAEIGELPSVCDKDENPPECATPPQRCEAFLRVHGIWQD
jgi:hypothetical protein